MRCRRWRSPPELRPHRRSGGDSPWKLAAGSYVHVLSEQQLFTEGNHRTGALLGSFVLARAGYPLFVLTVKNARAYFDPSTLIKKTKKHAVRTLFRLPRIRRKVAEFLERQAVQRSAYPVI